MIFKPDRSTNVCNNFTVSRLVCRNFNCDFHRHNRFVQNLHQTLESPRSAPTIASKTLKKHMVWHLDCLNPTRIARSTFWLISSIDHLRHPLLFFLWLVAASLHGISYAMPSWARRARLAVCHWRWSDHHLRIYHVQIWASLSLNDCTLINILQKSSIFTLEQIWTFSLSSSSWCLRRTLSTRHLLLHLKHSSFERTPSALVSIVNLIWYQLLHA